MVAAHFPESESFCREVPSERIQNFVANLMHTLDGPPLSDTDKNNELKRILKLCVEVQGRILILADDEPRILGAGNFILETVSEMCSLIEEIAQSEKETLVSEADGGTEG